MIEIIVQYVLIFFIGIWAVEQFLLVVVFWQYIQVEDIGQCIIVEVSYIGVYGKMGNVFNLLFEFVFKGIVFLIDIEVVFFNVVIGDVKICLVIFVDI